METLRLRTRWTTIMWYVNKSTLVSFSPLTQLLPIFQGVANETFFMPGPATDLSIRAMLIEQHSPPEILVHGLVAPEDVDKLFDM